MSILPEIQNLYDRNLFLQAFQRSADYWQPSTDMNHLSMEELILGGRLALRLGGWRLSRRLFMAAYEKDPVDPRARYYISGIGHRGPHLFDDLRAFELQPDLGGDDPVLRSSWFALHALHWAGFRDFSRAQACLERAQFLAPRDSWVLTCESSVLGLADQWEKALTVAEQAWELSLGAPFAAQCLGNSLTHAGRVEEAAQRLAAAAEKGESCEVALCACYYLCALAEMLDGEKRGRIIDRARALAETLPAVAPLADREAHLQFARTRLDIEVLQGDHDEILQWAIKARSPLYLRFAENLRKHPKGRRICLPFRRVLQRGDTCLPASMSAVLAVWGIEADTDSIASEITFGGTRIWAAAEWLEKRGLVPKFFIVQAETAASLIQNSIPYILHQDSERGGHSVAAIGLDEAAETLLMHDPNSCRILACPIENIGDHEAPLGPLGLAVVPPDKATLLDRLLPPDQVEAATACSLYLQTVEKNGTTAARQLLDELSTRYPDHPMTQYLRAIQLRSEGRTGDGLRAFQQLLNRYPNCDPIRRDLLLTCRALGNTALIRDVLKDVVERGVLPGVRPGCDWHWPPLTYFSLYADQLRLSDATRHKARQLLRCTLWRDPARAEAWHVLGDLIREERDTEGMLLCYRIACCLESSNEHHASAYCQALHSAGREEEGLAWLEARVRSYGSNPFATGPWISWIGALETCGHPEQALAACEDALQTHGTSAELLAFAAPFWARLGQWGRAEDGLRRLEASGNPSLYFEAATSLHLMRGDLAGAVRCAEAWVRESPLSMNARADCLNLLERQDGKKASAGLAACWSSEHPGHDQFELLYYHQLESLDAGRKQDVLLLRRVRRNSEDGWAWRELASRRMAEYQLSSDSRREKLLPGIEKLLSQCDRTAPEDPATLRVKARWHEVRGRWSDAAHAWLKAMDAEPADLFSYRRAWECCAGLKEADRRRVLARIETMLSNRCGRMDIARDLIFLVAQRFGFAAAEEATMRWKSRRPDDPAVTKAAADLFLEYGHGRSDSLRSLATLESAVLRYPYHIGLRLSLVQAYSALGKNREAEEIMQKILRRLPDKTFAYIQLASIQERGGDADGAGHTLETAAASDPLNPQIWTAQAGLLMRSGRFSEARFGIQDRLQRLPESAQWRDTAVRLLLECGDEQGAVDAAREGIQILPRNAWSWYCLAQILMQVRHSAAAREIETCLRRAISFDGTFFQAADTLAVILVKQRRFDEAEAILRHILPRMADTSPAQGLLCWIRRIRGHSVDALEEMAILARAAPWFRWGWERLMDWLLEDEKWDIARGLLCPVPPELATDARFRWQRLRVLAAAGTPAAALDTEWNELLEEFPDDAGLHLERYDDLRYQNRFAESAVVLKAIRQIDSNNSQVLARSVEVLSEENKQAEALDALLRVCFAERGESPWPAEYAWTAARNGRFDAEAYQKARQRLAKGSRPTLPAFEIMATRAKWLESVTPISHQPYLRVLFPGPGARELMALMNMVDRAPWADGRFRAILFQHLSELGYHHLVIRYWKKHPIRIEVDVDSWSSVGLALQAAHRHKKARRFLAAWRERPGVGMWVIACYVRCFSRRRKEEWREVLASCRDALAGLPHDHCAKYLAHVQAEMCALLDDSEAFRETWIKRREYFTGQLLKGEWFEYRRVHLLSAIPRLGSFLDNNRTGEFLRLCRQLRKGLPSPPSTAAETQGSGGIPWWVWILLCFLAARTLGELFRK